MNIKIRNRHHLKNKEIKSILDDLTRTFSSNFFDTKSSVEIGEIDEYKLIIVDGKADFMIKNDRIFFTLSGLYRYQPKEYFVVVDMGAVPFVINGADIMAAGIVDADRDIHENDQVWVCDEKHRKPLAVGIALIDGKNMISEKRGKAVKNIHYVDDKLWNLSKNL